MKKLLSTVLALSASLFFGLLLTGCSYFDFVGGGTTTIVEKEVITETIYESVLKACSCWSNSNGVVEKDEMLNNKRYFVEVIQEHRTDVSGNIVNGSYLIKCTKCTWACTYEGTLHHNLKTEVEGTCNGDAYERTRCTDCSLVLEEKTTTIEHSYPETPISVSEPTCTTAGTKTFQCTNSGCKHIKTETYEPALNHDLYNVYVGYADSSFCTNGGYIIEKCKRCNEEVSNTEVTSAPGHVILMEEVADDPTIKDYMIGWKNTKLPSDTEKGELEGYCSICKKAFTCELPALNLEDYGYIYDCKEHVITYKAYVDCKGQIYTEKPTDVAVTEFVFKTENATTYHTLNNELMLGNRYPSSLKGVHPLCGEEATCLKDGGGYFICENELCQEPVEIVTYKEHSYDSTEVIPYDGQEPTCADKGLGYAYCTECKTERKDNIEIPELGHTYEIAYIPVVEYNPETGEWSTSLKIPCSECDHYETSTAIEITASKAPTCLSSGYATCKYVDYNGQTVTKTILLYMADGTNPEGHGHNEENYCEWNWYDEETGYTHYCTGFTCPYCGVRLIKTEIIKDANGNVIKEIICG